MIQSAPFFLPVLRLVLPFTKLLPPKISIHHLRWRSKVKTARQSNSEQVLRSYLVEDRASVPPTAEYPDDTCFCWPATGELRPLGFVRGFGEEPDMGKVQRMREGQSLQDFWEWWVGGRWLAVPIRSIARLVFCEGDWQCKGFGKRERNRSTECICPGERYWPCKRSALVTL